MSAPVTASPWDVASSVLKSFQVNEKVNQFLLAQIDEAAWRLDPPGKGGRTIAATFAHIHSVRLMWLKASQKEVDLPPALDKANCTPDQVAAALSASARGCSALIENALRNNGKIKNFKPDVVQFVAYLISHEAHHRGQISQLARQCGYPLPKNAAFAMWEWGSLAKSL